MRVLNRQRQLLKRIANGIQIRNCLDDGMIHFGLKIVKVKYSLNINREEFAPITTKPSLPPFKMLIDKKAYTDDTYSEYNMDWCQEYRKLCLENYDLNMHYFDMLDQEKFNNELNEYLARHKQFKSVTDLSPYDGVEGFYIMVLDEYRQIYIGKSVNILKRIRQHWNKTKPLDRVLFPMYDVKKSCFSIDFFRALDTTRIYAWQHKITEGTERKLIEDFPKEYSTNRIDGDVTTAIEAVATMRQRELDV